MNDCSSPFNAFRPRIRISSSPSERLVIARDRIGLSASSSAPASFAPVVSSFFCTHVRTIRLPSQVNKPFCREELACSAQCQDCHQEVEATYASVWPEITRVLSSAPPPPSPPPLSLTSPTLISSLSSCSLASPRAVQLPIHAPAHSIIPPPRRLVPRGSVACTIQNTYFPPGSLVSALLTSSASRGDRSRSRSRSRGRTCQLP